MKTILIIIRIKKQTKYKNEQTWNNIKNKIYKYRDKIIYKINRKQKINKKEIIIFSSIILDIEIKKENVPKSNHNWFCK